ncbi:MAG: DNA polymerase III subunit delta [Bacillota bacterium]|nr:MAG: DNA polymerase III subunit delta [Bacillota bacterium]
MKFTQLKKYLAEGNAAPVYLVCGEDAYFREKSVEYLKRRFVTEPQLNAAVFDGDAVLSSPEEFFAAAYAYPFMSEKRMVTVKEFYPKADFYSRRLKEYLENPAAETVLVIDNARPCDTLKKAENIVVIDCEKGEGDVLCKWIVAECAKNGVSVRRAEAEKIAEYSLRDMTKISGEVAKLVAFAGEGGEVRAEDVENLVVKDTEYQIYELTECVGRKNVAGALKILKDMSAKGEPPQRLLVSLYNYFRRLLHISLSPLSDAELAKALGVKEYAVKKSRELTKSFRKKDLKRATDLLAAGDYAAKSGKTDFDSALTNALFEILL